MGISVVNTNAENTCQFSNNITDREKTYILLSISPTVYIEVLLYCCSFKIYTPITTENEGSPQCFQGASL